MSETSAEAGSGSGKYRTLFELGQGGTANVSLAVARGPEGFKKLFVVKQLRQIYAGDPEFREMFMTEARLSARLNHPHVVQVYEVFERGATPTISMEYIEGQTLDAVLALGEPKLPLDLHLRVLADVLSGLHYSHELEDNKHTPMRVVHRDVSPHNVMISYEGVVKVLDFGIAKLAGSTIETQAGVIKGKLRYMPPEQIAGEDVDRRVDVFAVGVMLWEALSGVRLWKGLSEAAIMNRVLSGAIPEPSNEREPIAPELLAICKRALAPEREQRYQTALELELELENYLATRSHYASARELSRFMNERFAQVREEVSRRVDAELVNSDAPRPFVELDGGRAATPSRTGLTASRSLPSEPPRSKLWLFALGFVSLGFAIVVWGMRGKAVEPAQSIAVAAPRSVSIRIEARPESASISVDGVPVGNPYQAARAFDRQLHVVRVSAPGFEPEETRMRFDADVRIVSSLAPLPAPVPSASAVSESAPPRSRSPHVVPGVVPPSPSAAKAPAEDVCDPPFYYAGGIKKFKPECL